MANLFMRGEYKRSGRFLRLHKSATSGMFVPRGAFSPPLRADIRAVHCSSRSGQSTILQPKPRPLDLPYTSPGSPFSPQSPAQQPKTLREDLRLLPADIAKLLASTHPDLDLVSNYYFAGGGKHIRPLLVLLIARATNGLSPDFPRLVQLAEGSDKKHLEGSVAPEKVLNNHDQQEFLAIFSTPFALSSASQPLPPPRNRPLGTFPSQLPILPTQYRLAEISEMIHISSLFHDDVLDDAATRRNLPSAPAAFGNKVSVLGGVFVLGRWMTALAGLGNLEVVELLLSVTSDLVQGELMQLSPLVNEDGSIHREARALAWQQYMQKTYLKTATLLAKSARASVILGGGGRLADGIEIKDVAYAFGRNLGMAFQV
ncbi:terpenoid synthase [Calocera cornea HHB12733]|uniref:Terpenoid synthase n=1 Tax=Calocera cornea HHB12733 TaxID=1353952 RepID=A0A165F2X6_9BASI|nr:terpenoid synthase [Calocera cornea HHB12733]